MLGHRAVGRLWRIRERIKRVRFAILRIHFGVDVCHGWRQGQAVDQWRGFDLGLQGKRRFPLLQDCQILIRSLGRVVPSLLHRRFKSGH
ncbi:hypothetical protein D3C73_1329530 [compost metagenome]